MYFRSLAVLSTISLLGRLPSLFVASMRRIPRKDESESAPNFRRAGRFCDRLPLLVGGSRYQLLIAKLVLCHAATKRTPTV